MRIGVNLMFLVPGEVGGSEPLLTNLVTHVARRGQSIVVFGLRGAKQAFPEIARSCRVVETPWSRGAQGLRIAAENSWLQLEARAMRLDLLHHGVGTTPFLRLTPAAVTIHDIQYVHYPENFATAKLRWLRLNVPHSIRTANHICVPSAWVMSDLIHRLGADPDRITVVPFGSAGLLGPRPAEADEVRERYGLSRPFFFFPGRTYRHKNHEMLIRAFRPLAADADLVFTGPRWRRDAEVMRTAADAGIAASVTHLGQVPRRALAGLYRAAIALAYPTRFEGFGAPALEAMSVGCPVIASGVTAVPEVVGEAGILLDPDDEPAWTSVMRNLLGDAQLRSALAVKGTARAQTFDWTRSADLQIDAWERAIRR